MRYRSDVDAGKSRIGVRRAVSPDALTAAALTVGLFILVLGALRPGYWINDDPKIAWLLAGYPDAGGPVPYSVHTNLLVGLLLLPLLKATPAVNWFSVFLTLANVVSTAALLYVGLSGIRERRLQLITVVMMALALALMDLELSYTISAFMASVAGICLVWAGSRHPVHGRRELLLGGSLIVLGSLIRLQMVAIAIVIALPPLLLLGVRGRRLILVLASAGLVVLGAYGLGRIYVRARPDWNAFYAYTRVRESLHDSHRLFNVHGQIGRVGWSPNDQELFARWFFSDADTYSYDQLQYLVDHVSPYSQDPVATLEAWLPSFVGGRNSAFLISMIGSILLGIAVAPRSRTTLVLFTAFIVPLGVNAALAVTYKDPNYVQACTLAAGLLISARALSTELRERLDRRDAEKRRPRLWRFLGLAGSSVIAVGAFWLLTTLLLTSGANLVRRQDYARIRAELHELVRDGTLPVRALIISPAHGLPYEWSDPFYLDRPDPAYLDTGWITFSPAYETSLESFGIRALPDALVSRADVFLMTQQEFVPFLNRYYQEHYNLAVKLEVVYQMPNPHAGPDYDGIFLYRVRPIG